MMAIFENRGKQYKAKVGDFLKLPKINDLKKNDSVTFDNVIFMKDDKGQTVIGSPSISGIQIICQVIDQIRDKKIIVFKKKRRHNYRRKIGHRQDLTLLKIQEIKIASKSTSSDKNLSSSQDKVKSNKGESDGS
jgi:large subunit ribosomal protein L21